MKHILWIVIIAMICGGCQSRKAKETVETLSDKSQQKEAWWIKRNDQHKTPEASDVIDILKHDGYYVDPKPKKKCIYLTFDCGYENGYTPKILDILKEEKATAAFFVTKGFIRDNVELVKRMKKEGHVVGNHTVHHKSMPTLSDRDNKQEINDCAEYCKEATGYDMDKYFRPPMGEYNERTLAMTKAMGYKTIFWSIAYLDYDVSNQPGKDYVIKHFKDNYHNGAIPLIHNVSKSNTQALKQVIENLKKDGVEIRSLNDLPSIE